MGALWEDVLMTVENRIGAQNCDTWIRPAQLKSVEENIVEIEVPSPLFRDWIGAHFLAVLESVMSDLLGRKVNAHLSVNRLIESIESRGVEPADPAPTTSPSTSGLIGKYTFSNFVVGSSNQFVHAACVEIGRAHV